MCEEKSEKLGAAVITENVRTAEWSSGYSGAGEAVLRMDCEMVVEVLSGAGVVGAVRAAVKRAALQPKESGAATCELPVMD
ncbi:hypothetical protein F0562_023944 [Nyssa sinensis]|uniref:Uncharacterized protein n=1 Tax=Nyssa sinensis TaxID=561372 RepID=A0A5J5BM46_9ASTE|nr:hypothetical protein F0562_023944 [Nyssa sinensis]